MPLDLMDSTTIKAVDEQTFDATLDPEWGFWGVNGGFIAAVLMRAGATAAPGWLPATFSAQFVARADFGPVEVACRTLSRRRRVVVAEATMCQRGELIAIAHTSFVSTGLSGFSHDQLPPPLDPFPVEDCPSMDDLRGDGAAYPIWRHIEERPITWGPDWPEVRPEIAEMTSWYRFRPRETFEDMAVDAGRLLILLDILGYPALIHHYGPGLDYGCPTMDLTVNFHRPARDEPWLLARGTSFAADHGLVGSRQTVWTPSGTCLATGSSQLLCRPLSALV